MKTINLFKLIPLLSLVVMISCSEEKKVEVKQEEKIKVGVQTVGTENVQQLETFTANVEAEVVNQIAPAIPARIRKIYTEVGSRVSQGQKLVDMDNTSFDQQQVQLNNLLKDYQRYQELFKVGGVSQQQLDQLKTQLDVLRTALSNLKENSTLVSPINGIVTARNYDDGDVFGQKPILTVEQLSPAKALVYISEAFFPRVKIGMPVDIKLDIYEGETFQGKVKLIYPTIDPNTHTFGCEISIPNSQLKIRPGMYARVIMNFGEMARVTVPDASVVKQSGSNDRFIFSVVDGKAVYNSVKVGQRLSDKWEIISGIKPGDVIVTSGQTKIVNGTQVEIVK